MEKNFFKDLHIKLGDLYLEHNGGFIGYQLKAFNLLISERLSAIFHEPTFEFEDKIYRLDEPEIILPSANFLYKIEKSKNNNFLMPEIARALNLSYSFEFWMRIVGSNGEKSKPIELFKMPVMLRSDFCNLNNPEALEFIKPNELSRDPGGYFIVKGHERVILNQMRLVFGRDLIYTKKIKSKKVYSNNITIKNGTISNQISIFHLPKKKLEIELFLINYANVKNPDGKRLGISLYVAFALLGYSDPKLLYSLFQSLAPPNAPTNFMNQVKELFDPTIIDRAETVKSAEDIQEYLRQNDYNGQILSREVGKKLALENFYQDVFPQIKGKKTKAIMLAYMTIRLFLVMFGIEKEDSRDFIRNNQFQGPAITLEKLIQGFWRKTKILINNDLDIFRSSGKTATAEAIAHIIQSKIKMTEEFEKNFINSKWGPDQSSQQTSITEELNRDSNLVSMLSQMTRIVVNTEGKGTGKNSLMENRLIQADQVGLICINETPDSDRIGLTRNHTWTSQISQEINSSSVLDSIIDLINNDETLTDDQRIFPFNQRMKNQNMVFFDGNPLGFCYPNKLFFVIRNYRRQGLITVKSGEETIPYFELGLGIFHENLWITSTSGRLFSPVIILHNGEPKTIGDFKFSGQKYIKNIEGKTFQELLMNGTVEYLDALERTVPFNAFSESYWHYARFSDDINLLIKKLENETDEQKRQAIFNQLKILQDENDYSHLVLDPNEIFGIAGSTIPFPERTKGPRIPYQCKMVNQAVNHFPLNHQKRFGPKIRNLIYSNMPLMSNVGESRVNLDEFGFGQTLMILFAAFEGNQEDSVIWNRASLDKLGVFIYETLEANNQDEAKQKIEFYKPFPKANERSNLYENLDNMGFPEIGAQFEDGEMIIGILRYPKNEEKKYSALLELRKELFTIENEIDFLKTKPFLHLEDDINKYKLPKEKIWISQISKLITYLKRNNEKEKLEYYEKFNKIIRKFEDVKQLVEFEKNNPSYEEFEEKAIEIFENIYKDKLKILQNSDLQNDLRKSVYAKKGSKVFIDDLIVFGGSGLSPLTIRVRTRQKRIVSIGHKQNPRFGQKSTVGLILDKRDIPFSENGMVPDVIINPLAIISRMTLSWVLEVLTGKIDALSGTQSESDAYRPFTQVELIRTLETLGFSSGGTEVFYSGITGRKFDSKLFVGPSYITQLKHMAEDKYFVRSLFGKYDIQTGLPKKGRTEEGGAMRWGVMETDSTLAHGTPSVVHERLTLSSGSTRAVFCIQCGTHATFQPFGNTYICRQCGKKNFGQVVVSKASQFILKQLSTANIINKHYFEKIKDIEEYNSSEEESEVGSEEEESEEEEEEEEDEDLIGYEEEEDSDLE